MRVRHDLLGCANRLRQTASDFRESVAQVREVWRDQRAERFEREDLSDLDQIMEQLTIQLQKASEMIGRMDRQLRDESEE